MAGFRVIAPDLPGHGRSGGVGLQTVQAYTRSLLDFLACLGLYQVVLVGHSMGGAIALQAALQVPEQVVAVGVISTGARFFMPAEIYANWHDSVALPRMLTALEARLFRRKPSRQVVGMTMQQLRAVRPAVLIGDWRACDDYDLTGRLAHMDVPVWVSVGAEDRLTPLPLVRELAQQVPGAQLEVIPGAGHMVILEQPMELAARLQSFLLTLGLDDPSLWKSRSLQGKLKQMGANHPS